MFKTLTAGLMALSLTFTSVAPAQANGLSEDDIGKLLLGLVATAAIASAIKNNRDDDRGRVAVPQKPRIAAPVHQPRHQPRGHDRFSSVPAPLPAQCLRILQTRHGTQRIFGERCLSRNYAEAYRLPASCGIRFNTDRGLRSGYDARCLRQNGYSLQR